MEYRTFERVVETGGSSSVIIATGLVEMDPREPEDHVRQRLVDLPVFHGAPAIQTSFFSPDGNRAPPMIAWDLTLVPETKKTILKITGQTIDAQPVKKVRYFCYYSAMGQKPQSDATAETIVSGREPIVLDKVAVVEFKAGTFKKPPIVVASVHIDPYPGKGEQLAEFESSSLAVGPVTEKLFQYCAKIGKIPDGAKAYMSWIATEQR